MQFRDGWSGGGRGGGGAVEITGCNNTLSSFTLPKDAPDARNPSHLSPSSPELPDVSSNSSFMLCSPCVAYDYGDDRQMASCTDASSDFVMGVVFASLAASGC